MCESSLGLCAELQSTNLLTSSFRGEKKQSSPEQAVCGKYQTSSLLGRGRDSVRVCGINFAEMYPIFLLPRVTGVHKLFLKEPNNKYFRPAGHTPSQLLTLPWSWDPIDNSECLTKLYVQKQVLGGIWPTGPIC